MTLSLGSPMTSESWFSAFLDADVLAAPLTRTMLILCGTHPKGLFGVRWSLAVESEAERHLRPGQLAVKQLRERFDWGSRVLVPDAPEDAGRELSGTSVKDRHVLLAAAQARIPVIVSRNVTDFGREDLVRSALRVVHPDLFLATMVPDEVYRDVLEGLASARTRKPNTPESLHAALGAAHPRFHAAMSAVFPDVAARDSIHKPATDLFRGVPFCVGERLLGPPSATAAEH
jgi:hypothetical protein